MVLGAAACNSDKLTNLNINPNGPAAVPVTTLFTSAVDSTTFHWYDWMDYRIGEILTQHLAEVQYPDEDRYTRIGGGSTTAFFDGPFEVELEDLDRVGQHHCYGVARLQAEVS